LALVQNGDWIELDTANRRLSLEVDDAELAERRKNWKPTHKMANRDMCSYITTCAAVAPGCGYELLCGGSGSSVTRDSH